MSDCSKCTKIVKCAFPWNFTQLVTELKANGNRQFLKDGESTTFIERNSTKIINHGECYDVMLGMLNAYETEKYGKRDRQLRYLLMELWRKYENNLRVVKYDTKEKDIGFKECSGVSINLKKNMENEAEPETWYKPKEEKKISWRIAYHTIFHEFFHHIDNLSNTHSYDYKDRKFKYSEKKYQFGEIIMDDVWKLLEEDKKASPKDDTLLKKITHNTEKRNKTTLYDIIGAVFYKGQYGCNPVSENCEYEYWCDPLSRSKSDYSVCEYRMGKCFSSDVDNKCVYRYECKYSDPKDSESIYKQCKLKDKYWCRKNKDCEYRRRCNFSSDHKDGCLKNKTYGHEEDYWLNNGEREFPKLLAEEAFASMAAEAIVNPIAYENIKKYLPESEKMFREILIKMSCEENHRQYWIQCENQANDV